MMMAHLSGMTHITTLFMEVSTILSIFNFYALKIRIFIFYTRYTLIHGIINLHVMCIFIQFDNGPKSLFGINLTMEENINLAMAEKINWA